jgi:hypothetical protein
VPVFSHVEDAAFWVRRQPRDVAVVFAFRAALRVIPLMSLRFRLGREKGTRPRSRATLGAFRSVQAASAAAAYPGQSARLQPAARAAGLSIDRGNMSEPEYGYEIEPTKSKAPRTGLPRPRARAKISAAVTSAAGLPRCVVSGWRRRVDDRRAVDDRRTGDRSADECTGDDADTNGAPAGTAPAAAAAPAISAAPARTGAPTRTTAPTADSQNVVRRRVLQGERTGERCRRGAIHGDRYTCSQHRRSRKRTKYRLDDMLEE